MLPGWKPIGSHPSPISAARATARGPPPASRIGIGAAAAMIGLSALPVPVAAGPSYGSRSTSPSIATGPARSNTWRMTATYSRSRVNGRAHGWPYQPSTSCGFDNPTPATTRPPPASRSIVARLTAAVVGGRAASWINPVASLMREVLAARNASGVRASAPYASADQTESNPSSSARCTSPTSSAAVRLDQVSRPSPSRTGDQRSRARTPRMFLPACMSR